MASGAHANMADLARAIRREALEGRHADIGRDVPYSHVDLRAGEEVEHRKASGIVDRREIDTPSVLLSRGALSPKRRRVALDQLAQRVARRLQNVVAGRETVRAPGETAAHRRSVDGRMGVNQLEGDPNGLAVNQVTPFHPQQRGISVEAAVGDARQEIDLSSLHLFAQFSVARETDWQLNVFGVPRLDRFHQT